MTAALCWLVALAVLGAFAELAIEVYLDPILRSHPVTVVVALGSLAVVAGFLALLTL